MQTDMKKQKLEEMSSFHSEPFILHNLVRNWKVFLRVSQFGINNFLQILKEKNSENLDYTKDTYF